MGHRFIVSICVVATVVVVVSLAQDSVFAQAPASARPTVVGRTPWGDPDLQGIYTFSTPTPLERPNSLAGRGNFTEAEIADLEERAQNAREADVITARPGELGASYNAFWTATEKGRLTGRTSLIVEPEDGRMPPLTPEAKKSRDERVAEAASRRVGTAPFVHTLYNIWTDHPSYTRCVSRPMPRVFQSYNHGVQILQTPGQVVIHYESMHDVRVIPLDGRPHIDSNIRQWNGDSRGHWEGDTLVVDWTNFSDKQEWEGGVLQGTMRFTERFTKIDANTINYEVTVTDPATWTKPWTFVLPWRSDDPNYQKPEDLYEFACHEGNYRMMEDSLNGTRALKQGEAAKK